jgi:hypothetical protein
LRACIWTDTALIADCLAHARKSRATDNANFLSVELKAFVSTCADNSTVLKAIRLGSSSWTPAKGDNRTILVWSQ